MIEPEPDAVQVAPLALAHVHVALSNVAGRLSTTCEPGDDDGPALRATIV